MISVLIGLLVLAVVVWVANLVLDMTALPPQVKLIVQVVLGLIVVLFVLRSLGVVAAF